MSGKRYVSVVLLLALLAVAVVPALAAPDQCQQVVHVVQAGDTMYSIARRYGVSVTAISNANGIVNPNFIYVGQRLTIPVCQPSTPPPSGGAVHVVQPGETLFRISLRYGVSVWSIANANGIVNVNHIYVGQRLKIPGTAPAPKPTAAPAPSEDHPGPWQGEYFGNVSLTGDPFVTREDEAINFNWGYGPPAGGMPVNSFSVRWTGTFDFSEASYRFYAKVDDGVRLYVDDELVIDGWWDGGYRLFSGDRALTAGEHTVTVEFYDRIQVARVRVWWKQVSGATATPGPSPTPKPGAAAGWFGEFFNNETLAGTPVATRVDPWIGFDWGEDGPIAGVWGESFSARWTREVSLNTDHYRFCARADDGVRIYVDDALVLDEWHANNGVAYCESHWVSTGVHDVQVEYYEHGGKALLYVWWEPH